MDCFIKMNNINLKAEKSVKFLCVIFDYNITFEEHIKNKIHGSQHVTSSFYSLKTLINLCKIFNRPKFDYGNAALITAEIKYTYKWEQIQMTA